MTLRSAIALALALTPLITEAHGVRVEATVTREVTVSHLVEVRAIYQSGRPMAGAVASVYAPGGGDEPWLIGECDDDGSFSFEPPPQAAGEWLVRVSHLGHGGSVSIEISPPTNGAPDVPDPAVIRAEASSTPHLSTVQRVVMGGCVIWGLLGTALFFSRRRA